MYLSTRYFLACIYMPFCHTTTPYLEINKFKYITLNKFEN